MQAHHFQCPENIRQTQILFVACFIFIIRVIELEEKSFSRSATK